ncbi:hypothetical protein HPP92_024777 [Vanilla planifolia]|uniref:Uncharacterized protein n=1 Tax=Vanilla planifolia TaxID=51239 RepID=A0A835U9R6_VANPL|nr:hypothetical protein HPP92_024777 [Vanilla planifolia]
MSGLSNANIGTEKARLAERWLSVQGHKVTLLFQGKKGQRKYLEPASPSTSATGAEVTHAILPRKALTTLNKNKRLKAGGRGCPLKVGRSDPGPTTVYQKHWSPAKSKTMYGRRFAQRPKVKEVGDWMRGEPCDRLSLNGGRNHNGPKVAKFLPGKFHRQTKANDREARLK